MAQSIVVENDMQTTVDFSTVEKGVFIYNGNVCVRIDKNNPNYVVLQTGVNGKLDDNDQVLIPNSVLLKLE